MTYTSVTRIVHAAAELRLEATRSIVPNCYIRETASKATLIKTLYVLNFAEGT